MAGHERSFIRILSEWLLRIAAIGFLFAFFFAMDFEEEAPSKFLDGFMGILKMVLFAGLSVVLVAFRKQYFKYTIFFLLMLVSLFRFLVLAGKDELQWEIFSYSLLFFLALYNFIRIVPKERKRYKK